MSRARDTQSDKPVMVQGLSEAATPHFHGHRQRLRDRFMEAGGAALADYELLELLLFRAIARRDVKPLAKALIARFGSFSEVIAARPERLREIDGLGEAAICEIKLVEAAARKLARGALEKRTVLSSFVEVIDYCRTGNYPPPFSARRSGARLLISAPPCQGVQSLNPCPDGTD